MGSSALQVPQPLLSAVNPGRQLPLVSRRLLQLPQPRVFSGSVWRSNSPQHNTREKGGGPNGRKPHRRAWVCTNGCRPDGSVGQCCGCRPGDGWRPRLAQGPEQPQGRSLSRVPPIQDQVRKGPRPERRPLPPLPPIGCAVRATGLPRRPPEGRQEVQTVLHPVCFEEPAANPIAASARGWRRRCIRWSRHCDGRHRAATLPKLSRISSLSSGPGHTGHCHSSTTVTTNPEAGLWNHAEHQRRATSSSPTPPPTPATALPQTKTP
jgi:hypothetical protein